MFLIKLHRNNFHFDKRQFSNLVQSEGGGGRIKTVVDERNKITRRTERGEWESVIGLEVHAQVNANSKIFSSAPHQYNSPVNTAVSYFDSSTPGTLPVLNRRCVEAGVLTSLALDCQINRVSFFDRKHYFYSDLPAGYQITQQRRALAVNGRLEVPVFAPELSKELYTISSSVIQLQLEQDSAKSLHDPEMGRSLVDLNRCGTGLMEIVFGPDLRHGEEAAALVKELLLILDRLQTCQARMERGEVRVDANISVRPAGQSELGVRTEVKNINSVRSVARAVEFEVERQIRVLEEGGTIENQTRSFDYDNKVTLAMRDKEAKQDYRFMPEPNLPPLRLCEQNIEQLRVSLPTLPAQLRARLTSELGLSVLTASQLVAWPPLLEYFNLCCQCGPSSYREVANLIFIWVQHTSTETNQRPLDIRLTPSILVEVSNLRQEKVISAGGLQEIFSRVLAGDDRTVMDILTDHNLFLIKDRHYIEQFAREVVTNNIQLVEKFRKEKKPKKAKRIYQSLINIVNKDSRVDNVDMKLFTQILKEMLEEQ